MIHALSLVMGKSVRFFSRLRGGGSALPGLIVEKLDHTFLADSLGRLPCGVVVVSGTNGKTTTVKIIKELLEGQGLRVFTNATGSNFKRGVISSIVEKASVSKGLEYDIAVLELDEAHAQHFIADVKPKYALLLNVMRDQLDRFGEIDYTAELLANIARATTDTVVLNARDDRVEAIKTQLKGQKVAFYGYANNLVDFFPSDDDLYKKVSRSKALPVFAASLETYNDQKMTFRLGKKIYESDIHITGIYNVYNAVGAICLVDQIIENIDTQRLVSSISKLRPAFGRGEVLEINGYPLQLVLVKNPISFRLGLKSYANKEDKVMIVINDQYADGRDMSWLWDVEFNILAPKVDVVSGTRAYDMGLRLQYDDIEVESIQPELAKALQDFVALDGPKTIFCTYTAMLELRKLLDAYADIERVL